MALASKENTPPTSHVLDIPPSLLATLPYERHLSIANPDSPAST